MIDSIGGSHAGTDGSDIALITANDAVHDGKGGHDPDLRRRPATGGRPIRVKGEEDRDPGCPAGAVDIGTGPGKRVTPPGWS